MFLPQAVVLSLQPDIKISCAPIHNVLSTRNHGRERCKCDTRMAALC